MKRRKTDLPQLLKNWKIIIGFIVFILGIGFSFDAIYARNDKVDLLAMRLDQKIEEDEHKAIRSRIWALEDRHQCEKIATSDYPACSEKVMGKSAWEEYRELWDEREQYEKERKKK